MAVEQKYGSYEGTCLSGDAKPTTWGTGSKLYETDTGYTWIYDGLDWVRFYEPVTLTTGDINIGNVDVASIATGETHIGEVGGNTLPVIVTPTITAGAYTANDIVGGKLTIANAARKSGGSGIIQSITVIDKGHKTTVPSGVELGFYFFSADVAGAYADNDAEAISAVDSLLNIGYAIVLADSYKTMTNYCIATVTNIGLPFLCATTSLYCIVRTPGAVTYASTSDLQFRFGILRD
jgi:hypothetical protein